MLSLFPVDLEYQKEVDNNTAFWKKQYHERVMDIEMRSLIFVEVLPTRHQTQTAGALKRTLSTLSRLHFPVGRLHSDRGGEWLNRAVRDVTTQSGILHTMTESDTPGSNGRAEAAVGCVKRMIRSRLESTPDLGQAYSSLAAVDAAANLYRREMKRYDSSIRPPLPWGTRVHVKQKTYRQTHWSSRMVEGILVGPSVNTTRGYVIALEPFAENRLIVSTTVCIPHSLDVPPVAIPGEIWNVLQPEGRIRKKSAPHEVAPLGDAEAMPLDDLAIAGGQVYRVDEGSAASPALDLRRATARIRRGLLREQSEEMAQRYLQQGTLDRSSIAALVFASLQNHQSRNPRMIDQSVSGTDGWVCSLGAYSHGSQQGLITESKYRPMLLRLVNRFIATLDATHVYTAVRLSFQVAGGWHRDLHNETNSTNLLVKLSALTGGRVVLEDGPVDFDGQGVVRFDPKQHHSVEPAVGPRLVLIAYTPARSAQLSLFDLNILLSLGFNVPVELRPQPMSIPPIIKTLAKAVTGQDALHDPKPGRECACGLQAVEGMCCLEFPLAGAVPGEFTTAESDRYLVCCMQSLGKQSLDLAGSSSPNVPLGGSPCADWDDWTHEYEPGNWDVSERPRSFDQCSWLSC